VRVERPLRDNRTGTQVKTSVRSAAPHQARLGAVPRDRMVKEAVKRYRVAYERDESGWWVASVYGVRGCHTQGRTVDEARRRIVEALKLFVDDARKARIVDDVKLPTAATRAIRTYATLRKKADEENRRATRAARRAVRLLRSGTLRMSARDAARLLGLSHQRVHRSRKKEEAYRRRCAMRLVTDSARSIPLGAPIARSLQLSGDVRQGAAASGRACGAGRRGVRARTSAR